MPEWSVDDARTTPVTDGCLWCKGHVPDAERVPVGDGELLCPNCRDDLREFKRSRFVDVIVSAGLAPATRRVVLDHWDAIRADLAAQYEADDEVFPLPRRVSNADDHDEV